MIRNLKALGLAWDAVLPPNAADATPCACEIVDRALQGNCWAC
jgi:hypothetical protein